RLRHPGRALPRPVRRTARHVRGPGGGARGGRRGGDGGSPAGRPGHAADGADMRFLSESEGADAPVRVCFLIDELAAAGTETQLLALVRRVDRRRVRPYLCLLRGESAASRALEPEDCPVRRLGVGSLLRPRTLLRLARFAAWLRRERIDVLQV